MDGTENGEGDFTSIKSLLQKLYNENAEKVEQALEEIGRVGKGNGEAMKALQEFLRKARTLLVICRQKH